MSEKYVVFRAPSSRSLESSAAPTVEEADLTDRAVADVQRDPDVRAVAPVMPLKLIEPVEEAELASDSETTSNMMAWGIEAVRAHESSFDGSGITVAVLDTGIDPNHSAFSGVTLVRKNFTTSSDDDTNGHGTHCAGTIFGRDVDNTRIGVARGVSRALIGKVLGRGGGSSQTIADAIVWAVQEGAHIISMSLGVDFPGWQKALLDRGYSQAAALSAALAGYRENLHLFSELTDYVSTASGQTIIVAASGNESGRQPGGRGYAVTVSTPAAGRGITSVGALQRGDSGMSVASFSNNQVDISAPGVRVLSAWPGGGLHAISGTSMATPHVAGVAALWGHRQLSQTNAVNASTLAAQTLASGNFAPLRSGWLQSDVGAGCVQSPI